MIQRAVLLSLALTLIPGASWADPYPAEVRDAFLGECEKGMAQAICECVLSQMEASIPLETLLDQSFDQKELENITASCLGLGGVPAETPTGPQAECLTQDAFMAQYLDLDEDELDDITEKEVDLGGSSESELIMGHISCGTSECTGLVLQKCEGSSDTARVIGEIDGFTITVLDSSTNGYKDLKVTGRDYDDDERPFETTTTWHFNGAQYVPK